MAIASVAKSFSAKLRLPFRQRQKQKPATPPPETTITDGGSCGSGTTTPPKPTKEEEFRQVFRYFDANNDGMISAAELRDYLASNGESVSLKEAEHLIRDFSKATGGDGVNGDDSLLLDFGGFVRMMDANDDVEKVLRQAFEMYEVDKGSGCITAEGLRRVLLRLGEVKSHQECEAMIRFFDLDGNGVVDFQEFHEMMTR